MLPVRTVSLEAPETVRVFSSLLDCGDESARLWHVLRSLDVAGGGSGWVTVHPRAIASWMGISVATVYNHLGNGMGKWFRSRYKCQGGIVVYLNSIGSVCASLGLSGLGSVADVPIAEMAGRSHAKCLATQLDAQAHQRRAFWATRKETPRVDKKRILKPWEIASSDNSAGANRNNRRSLYHFVPQNYQAPAGSIAGISRQTCWTSATIGKRLRNSFRRDRNIATLEKRRLAFPVDQGAIAFELAESGQSFVQVGTRVYKAIAGTVYRLGCHVYAETHRLLPCRYLRNRVRKLDRNVSAQVAQTGCLPPGQLDPQLLTNS